MKDTLKLLYILIICSLNSSAQNKILTKGNFMYVFKVTFLGMHYEWDGDPSAYSIIDGTHLRNLPAKQDTDLLPGVTYLITKNGGYYASDDTVDMVSKACCETGDIKENLYRFLYDSMPFDLNQKRCYNLFEKLHPQKRCRLRYYHGTEDFKGQKERFQHRTGIFYIEFWKVDMDYCICDIYRTAITQRFFGQKCAYIRQLGKIHRIKRQEAKWIKNRFKQILDDSNKK